MATTPMTDRQRAYLDDLLGTWRDLAAETVAAGLTGRDLRHSHDETAADGAVAYAILAALPAPADKWSASRLIDAARTYPTTPGHGAYVLGSMARAAARLLEAAAGRPAAAATLQALASRWGEDGSRLVAALRERLAAQPADVQAAVAERFVVARIRQATRTALLDPILTA